MCHWCGRSAIPAIPLFPRPKKMSAMIPVRLRQLANDCEERARLTINDNAHDLYRLAARDARQGAAAAHLGSDQRGAVLAAMSDLARLARWYDGAPESDQASDRSDDPEQCAPLIADELLNARQLCATYGMSENGARKAIERGLRRGLVGFYRDGALWLAERGAFASILRRKLSASDDQSAGVDATARLYATLRDKSNISSNYTPPRSVELVRSRPAMVRPCNDEADYASTIGKGRAQADRSAD